MLLGLLGAFGAALCYGVGSVLQAVAARGTATAEGLDPRLLLRLARSWHYLVGVALDGLGFVLAVAAVRTPAALRRPVDRRQLPGRHRGPGGGGVQDTAAPGRLPRPDGGDRWAGAGRAVRRGGRSVAVSDAEQWGVLVATVSWGWWRCRWHGCRGRRGGSPGGGRRPGLRGDRDRRADAAGVARPRSTGRGARLAGVQSCDLCARAGSGAGDADLLDGVAARDGHAGHRATRRRRDRVPRHRRHPAPRRRAAARLGLGRGHRVRARRRRCSEPGAARRDQRRGGGDRNRVPRPVTRQREDRHDQREWTTPRTTTAGRTGSPAHVPLRVFVAMVALVPPWRRYFAQAGRRRLAADDPDRPEPGLRSPAHRHGRRAPPAAAGRLVDPGDLVAGAAGDRSHPADIADGDRWS